MTTQITAKNWKDIQVLNEPVIKTGYDIFDKWFSRKSGMVKKSVILVTGTSGAGKTTLMMNIMKWLKNVKTYIYLREMGSDEVKEQTNNIVDHDNNWTSDDTDCPHFNDFMVQLDLIKPEVFVIDSIQAIAAQDFMELGEDKAMAFIRSELIKWTKKNNAICFIIGHNTKEGEFAGKNTNMQMIDAHMVLEAEDNKGTSEIRRIYWGKKNRKGSRSMMYYEIGKDGSITFFSPEEYAGKLAEIEKDKQSLKDIQITTNVVDMLESSIKIFLKGLDKSKPNFDSFNKEIKDIQKQYSKMYGNDRITYLAEYFKAVSIKSEIYKLN